LIYKWLPAPKLVKTPKTLVTYAFLLISTVCDSRVFRVWFQGLPFFNKAQIHYMFTPFSILNQTSKHSNFVINKRREEAENPNQE